MTRIGYHLLSQERQEELRNGRWTDDGHQPGVITPEEVEMLMAAGFCRTSNKYGLLSRIDRPDWKAVLEQNMGRDLSFGDGQWESHYRRGYSNDQVEIGSENARRFESSDWNKIGYIPQHYDPEKQLFTRAELLEGEVRRLHLALVVAASQLTWASRATPGAAAPEGRELLAQWAEEAHEKAGLTVEVAE